MFNSTVNIIEYNVLYEILHEIKDVLKFEIINYKNVEKFIEVTQETRLDQLNFIIITESTNQKLIKNKKIDKRKILCFNELPTRIELLVEKINIQLIKQKYNFQSNLNIKNYFLNLNTRIISIKEKRLKLTEKEIDIILYLNENKKPHKINILQKKVWGHLTDLETHTVETHVYRLRKKIKDTFEDDNFILSHDDGYFIE